MRILLLLLTAVVLIGGATRPPRQYYATIDFKSHDQLRRLVEEGYDVGGVDYENNRISVIVHEADMDRLRAYPVVDTQEIVLAPDAKYKKPDDIKAYLLKVQEQYPHLAEVEVIGKSIEQRDVYAVHLTAKWVKPDGERKPAVLFDAMHHAREIMTPEVALDIVGYLTSHYESDPKVQRWVDNYDIWVVPMVNPDGNNRVWTAQPMWRKNTRGGYGVDINRNYPYDWGQCNGSSGSQSSDIYRGASPASEPETQALMGLVTRIKPVFNISYHSYSEIVIYPFGCSPKKIPDPDRERYEGVGAELGRRLVRDSGSGFYRPGTAYELLYNVDGGSLDWMYSEYKVFSYVVEVNSSSQGFQPSYDQWRDITVQRQRAGWQYILEEMEDYL